MQYFFSNLILYSEQAIYTLNMMFVHEMKMLFMELDINSLCYWEFSLIVKGKKLQYRLKLSGFF